MFFPNDGRRFIGIRSLSRYQKVSTTDKIEVSHCLGGRLIMDTNKRTWSAPYRVSYSKSTGSARWFECSICRSTRTGTEVK